MGIKSKIKELPGVSYLLARRYDRRFRNETRCNLFRGVYHSFVQARHDIPDTKPTGYDNPEPPLMYRDVMQNIRCYDYPVLYWLKEITDTIDGVIDFGGHVGILFYGLSGYIDFSSEFRWNVYDVPSVVQEGKKMVLNQKTDQLRFFSELSAPTECDLFLASGSLQYFEEKLSDILKRLHRRPKHIIINMTPLHANRQIITVNNMGVAYCPYKIAHKSEFIQDLEVNGWQIRDTWENTGKKCNIPFQDGCVGIKYYGFYITSQV